MLTLITFPATFGEPSSSPFCVKAMILLQMSGQTWQREDIGSPMKMPHGKLPVLRNNGTLIPDSEFIQTWLTTQGADFFGDATATQRATGHAVIRMVEENLRLALVHDRWLDDRNWPQVWPVFFAGVPRPIRGVIARKARKSVRIGLHSNGFARLSNAERLEKANADLDALGHILGDQDFVLGAAPTAVDAAVLPMLSMIDRLPVATELTHLLRSKDWAQPYLQRGRDQLYAGLV